MYLWKKNLNNITTKPLRNNIYDKRTNHRTIDNYVVTHWQPIPKLINEKT
jgi:hypothetical protein